MIANGNVVRHDYVIFSLTTAQFARLVYTQAVDTHCLFWSMTKSRSVRLILVKISSGGSPGSVSYCELWPDSLSDSAGDQTQRENVVTTIAATFKCPAEYCLCQPSCFVLIRLDFCRLVRTFLLQKYVFYSPWSICTLNGRRNTVVAQAWTVRKYCSIR
jgi:hypothetical protein